MGVSQSSQSGKTNSFGEVEVYTNESVLTHTEEFAGAQAGAVILTPTAGKKLEIRGVYVSTADKLTDVDLTFNGGTVVFYLHTTNTQTSSTGAMHIDGAVNETLKITCGAGTFVLVMYYEK